MPDKIEAIRYNKDTFVKLQDVYNYLRAYAIDKPDNVRKAIIEIVKNLQEAE